MALDLRKVLKASLLIIVVATALVISSIILRLVPVLIEGPEAETLSLVGTVYYFLLTPVFLVLYFWAGFRATKKFRLDAVEGGAVAAFSFFVTGIIQLLLETVLSVLFASHVIAGTFISSGAAFGAVVFGETASGGTGILLSTLCGLGVLAIGSLINFVVGGAGSLTAQR